MTEQAYKQFELQIDYNSYTPYAHDAGSGKLPVANEFHRNNQLFLDFEPLYDRRFVDIQRELQNAILYKDRQSKANLTSIFHEIISDSPAFAAVVISLLNANQAFDQYSALSATMALGIAAVFYVQKSSQTAGLKAALSAWQDLEAEHVHWQKEKFTQKDVDVFYNKMNVAIKDLGLALEGILNRT